MVSKDVAATASSAQGDHHGQESRLVSSRFAITFRNAPSLARLQLNSRSAALEKPRKNKQG